MFESMKKRKQTLSKVIADANLSLQDAPEGSLQVRRTSQRTQAYQNLGVNAKNGKRDLRYLKKEDAALIRELAQKDYDQRVIKAAKEELKFIAQTMENYPRKTAESVFEELDEFRQKRVESYFQSDEDYVREWLDKDYEPKPFRNSDVQYHTNNSEMVRSKSEVIIANMLHGEGIPYLYEYPISLKEGVVLHPDFTVLNVRERKTMIWEHLGMMDDEEYSRKALKKILLYERNGIYPGDRLILTHETAQDPLDTRIVQGIIHKFLL